MDVNSEKLRAEYWQLQQLQKVCGLSKYEASLALDFGIDYHTLEKLQKSGCKKETAFEILK
jgi:hypothetical protein